MARVGEGVRCRDATTGCPDHPGMTTVGGSPTSPRAARRKRPRTPMTALRVILTRIVDDGHHAVRRRGDRVRRHPRRARRSDRDDAAARRLGRGHGPAARALRARQIDPRAVRHLARQRRARRFRHLDLAAPERALNHSRAACPATLELCLLALLIAAGCSAGRWRSSRRAGARRRRRPASTWRAASRSRCPISCGALALILAFGVAVPGLRDFRPRLAAPRPSLRHRFYLLESMLRLRFDITRDLLNHMLMPAVGAGAAARRGASRSC